MNNYIPASPLSYLGHQKNSTVPIQETIDFLEKNTLGILHCVAEDVSNEKQMKEFSKRVDKSLNRLTPYTKQIPLYIDSGGFQVMTGKYTIEDVKKLSEEYYSYLKNNPNKYSKAFVLDLPPNDFCFKNWSEVEAWNDKTYKIAAEMNDLNNIFVFHLLNFESYKIWDRLFEKYHQSFGTFAVGGIAIKQYGRMNRIISYSVPFKVYLDKCLKHDLDSIRVHFLGAGQSSTVLTFLFALCAEFFKREYGILFEVQSDSCQHQRLARARKFQTIEDGQVIQMDYFTKNLNFMFKHKTWERYILDTVNEFASNNGFSIQADKIYHEDGRQDMDFYVLLSMYDLYLYKKIQEIVNENVSELLDYYMNGDIESFYTNTLDFLQKLNGGKLTKNLRNDTVNMVKFLDIMKDDNLDRLEMLMKQNSTNLFQNDSMLTF